jgi:glycosyltransferase involved in cell wall biosynthesis
MNSPPLLSVIVPAFNRADLIAETLDSVLDQRGVGPYEVIVVDDGSTDATPEVLARYGDRILVLRQENSGVSAARNQAIAKAGGRLIALCDSDDLWLPDKLACQLAAFADHPAAGMVYGDFVCFETEGGKMREWRISQLNPSGYVLPALLHRCFVVPSTTMFTREAALAAGGFDTSSSHAEDYDFFLRLAARREVVFCGRICCRYRQHASGLTRQRRRQYEGFVRTLAGARRMIAEMHCRGELRDPIDQRKISAREVREWDAVLRKRIASFHLRLANLHCREGHPAPAWSEAQKALRLIPTSLEAWSLLWKSGRQRLGLRSPR